MSKVSLFLICLFAGSASAAIGGRLVSFPYAATPCTISGLSCTCCTGVQVAKVGFQKTVCVLLSFNLWTMGVDVTIKVDNKVSSQFSFSATNPPKICIPIMLPINLNLCLKIHDLQIISGPGIQLCMTIYGSYGANKNYVIPLNCVTVAPGSLKYFTTTTTTTTTRRPATTTTKSAATTTTTTTPAPKKG